MRTKTKSPVLIVDSGNLLFKHPLSGADTTASLVQAHGIIRAYTEIGYDAVAVSASDLTAGQDFFQASLGDSFPWVSANIFNNNEKLLFPPHNIKKAGSLSIGIIGLTGGGQSFLEDFTITDWHTPLKNEIEQLEKSCDMLLVLSSLSEAENKEISRDFPQIDLIVTAYQNRANIPPHVSENSLLSQSAGRGKYIGQLEIGWHPLGKWLVDPSQSSSQLANKLSSIDRQILQLEKQQTDTSRDLSQKIAGMRSYRNTISDQIAFAETKLVEKEKTVSNSFKSTFLPIKPTSSPDNIENIVQDIKKSINALNRHRRDTLKPEAPAFHNALQTEEIAGVAGCRKCHEKQTAFWQNTAHANAFTTLSTHGQSFNLECLPCHVTAGKVSPSSPDSERLFLLSLGEDRQTIGCEVCHGPAKKHLLSPDNVTPVRSPPEGLCTKCHTQERDGNFEYSAKLPTIACPAG